MELPPDHPNRKKHRKQASQKQLIAISLVSQGLSKTEAMRRAGYSKSMINTPKQVFTSQAIMTAVDKFKLELKDKGLTTDYMASKLAEWLEAGSIEHPDYQTQLKAYEFLKQIVIDEEKKQDQPIKRTMTLTEYLQPNISSSKTTADIDPLQDLLASDQPHILDLEDRSKNESPVVLEEKNTEKTLEELII